MQVIHQPVNFAALNVYGSLYGSITYTSYVHNVIQRRINMWPIYIYVADRRVNCVANY